ncbi:hypothetical protein CIY_26650 [Butyrivibrio fibrisolvens 16/4]|nr:hypothetical protein CIY_26650 [Butyrivibrio fibrisolvens 16/4]
MGIYAGVFSLFLAFILMIYSIVQYFLGTAPDGYSTLIVVLCFMFGVLFIILGIYIRVSGDYICRSKESSDIYCGQYYYKRR